MDKQSTFCFKLHPDLGSTVLGAKKTAGCLFRVQFQVSESRLKKTELLFLQFFPILCRAFAHQFFEFLVEIIHVLVSDLFCNLIHF